MPFVFRKIRRARWVRSPDLDWLAEGELQADALLDVLTENNKLSVYLIEDDRSNFQQVVAALAANRDKPANMDYALIDMSELMALDIQFAETSGETVDTAVNAIHRDLIKLTAAKVAAMSNVMLTQGEIKRVKQNDVIQWIAANVLSGNIKREEIKITSERFEKKLDSLIN